MKNIPWSKCVQIFLVIVFLFNAVACTTPTATSGSTTVVSPVNAGTAAPLPTPTLEAIARPEPWEEDGAEAFMREIDWNNLGGGALMPFVPTQGECAEFWDHQQERHLLPYGVAQSVHSVDELIAFLTAVATGDTKAELIKAATRLGGGIVGLFRFNGRQWLFFTGGNLTPSAYRPLNQDAVKYAINGSQVYKNPPASLRDGLRNSADCYKQTRPATVPVPATENVKVPVSEFAGQYDFNFAPIPVVGETATPPVFVPVPVGSYGMPIPISGTPPSVAVPSNYTYSPEHAVFLWTPEGGFGLTPMQMAEVIMLGGGTFVVVGAMAVTAEFWMPVVVIGAPTAGSLIPAFAP